MKRILCLLCALALMACLFAACGKEEPAPVPGGSNEVTESNENTETAGGSNDIDPNEYASALSEFNQMFSTTWPENEFTKQVPKPKFDTSVGVPVDNGFAAVCTATVDELKDYVKDLKRAGFTKGDNTTDQSALGFTVYSYQASNSKGYTVEVTYSNAMGANVSAISITKGS